MPPVRSSDPEHLTHHSVARRPVPRLPNPLPIPTSTRRPSRLRDETHASQRGRNPNADAINSNTNPHANPNSNAAPHSNSNVV